MGRGGIGARKNMEEKLSRAKRYQLIGVSAGSPVAECLDKYRRWDLGHRLGVIVRNSGSSVSVQWEDEEGFAHYSGADARYKVDTNIWRIGQPSGKSPLRALTSGGASDSILPSPQGDTHILTKENRMAEDKATPKERETYTAKQVATRINTDAKTLRKFFRSPASTVEPVGQGGRYEFDAKDLPKIKAEFDKWNTTKVTRPAKGDKNESKSHRQIDPVIEDEDDEELELDDDPEVLLAEDDEEEEDEIEEEADTELTEEEIKSLTLPKLRTLADERGIDHKGLKKADLLQAILDPDEEEEEDDEDIDLDELDDEEED